MPSWKGEHYYLYPICVVLLSLTSIMFTKRKHPLYVFFAFHIFFILIRYFDSAFFTYSSYSLSVSLTSRISSVPLETKCLCAGVSKYWHIGLGPVDFFFLEKSFILCVYFKRYEQLAQRTVGLLNIVFYTFKSF